MAMLNKVHYLSSRLRYKISESTFFVTRIFYGLIFFVVIIPESIIAVVVMVFFPHAKSFSSLYTPLNHGYTVSYTKHHSFVQQLRIGATSSLIVTVCLTVISAFLATPQPVLATIVACPVTDGGAGDGDGSANGTIQLSANTTWTMPSGASGDYWDCTGKNILITGSIKLTLAGDTASGAYPYIKTDNLQIDVGSSISGDGKGCTAGKAPNSLNVCTAGATGVGVAYADSSGGGGHGGAGGHGSSGSATGGVSIDSVSAPIYFGSASSLAVSAAGATGGGSIRIDVTGTITHNGSMTVNGNNGTIASSRGSGGGSGGTINITAGTLAGTTGTFSATGGAGGDSTSDGGGGGGGRVAIVCTTCTFLPTSSSFTLTGGTATGTATVGAVGSAYVRNATADAATIYGNFVLQNTTYTFTEALTLDTASIAGCGTGAATPSIVADSLMLGGTITCTPTALTALTLTATTGAVNMASGTVLNVNVAGAALNIDQPAGVLATWTNATITGNATGSFVLNDAVSVSIAGTTSITGNMNWTNLTDVTMASGASLTCGAGATAPVVSAGTINLAGTFTCTPTTLTSLTLTSTTGAVNMASGTVLNVNVASAALNIDQPAGVLATWTDATITGGRTGTFVINDAVSVNLAGTTSITGNVNWSNLVDVTIASGASIHADSEGCASLSTSTNGYAPDGSNVCTVSLAGAGRGTGAGTNANGSGGGAHGGPGGKGQASLAGGASYDSLTAPALYGASGGAIYTTLFGGTGGGLISIQATGTVTNEGTLTALGGTGPTNATIGAGGGAGGSIYISSGTYAGTTGTFSVVGGAGGTASYDGGGGGGGRVAVICSTCTHTFAASDFTLTGGVGPAEAIDGTMGSAYVKNVGSAAETIYGYFEVENQTYTFTEALTFDTGSTPTCDSAATAPVISADVINLAGTFTCTPTTLTSLTLASTTGAVNMASGTVLNVNVASAALNINQAAGASGTWTNATITGGARGTFFMNAGSVSLAGTTSINANVNWTSLVDVAIASGASIHADSEGCASLSTSTNGYAPDGSNVCTVSLAGAGRGTGAATNVNGSGGGAHGGAGGKGQSSLAGGVSYDDITAPVLFGASGGAIYTTLFGGTGGGLISIQATGTVTNEGTLTALGGAGPTNATIGAGGGAGGSIYISTSTFAGTTGTFSVVGGAGGTATYNGGGGGGGRVAILYRTNSSSYLAGLTAAGVAPGGVGPGAALDGGTGTLYTATVPTQPSITAPADAATGVSRNPLITASVYSGDLSHLSTDWQVATDSGFTAVVWSSITDTDDLENIIVNSTKGTFAGTLAGLTELNPATYYVRARYANLPGNSTYSTTTSFTTRTTNTAPTVSSVTAAEKTDDTSVVDVSFIANDANADDQVMVKVELDIGAGYIDPTLSAVNGDTTATYGDPTVDNAATYQIGTSAAWITTSSGANTINFDLAASNFTGANTTATVRLTPNDQGVDGTPVTQTFTIDDVNPTLPGSFANTAATGSTATFTWVASTETNFNHYEIWYGTNSTDVANRTGTASEWDNDPNDSALATRTTATTTVTGLSQSTAYYTIICAVDNYGNTTCSPSPITFTTLLDCPVTDGGIGDGDGSANGTIQISANTTWTMPSGATGGFWNCIGKNILITTSSTLTLAGNTVSGAYPYIKTDNLQIDSGSSISGDGKGCANLGGTSSGGYAPDPSTNICAISGVDNPGGAGAGAGGGGGGGYGGKGGAGSSGITGGYPHGSINLPIIFGASGGKTSGSAAGAGGGVVRLDISGTFTHNGSLTAAGAAGSGGGAGSGGAIYVVTNTLAGAGTFSVAGGVPTGTGGGGAGGRAAIVCTTCTFLPNASNFTLTAGIRGEIGSAYVRNATADAATIYGNFIFIDTTYTFTEALTLDTASISSCYTGIATHTITADSLTLGGTTTCTAAALTSLTLTATTGAVNMASGTVLNVNVAGAALNINQGAGASGTWNATITGGSKGTFVMDDAASVTLAGTTSITGNVNWTNLVNVTVASGASINANSKGCTNPTTGSNGYAPNGSNVCTVSGTGAGIGLASGNYGGGGGGHGGAGGASNSGVKAGGSTYDSLSAPALFGASGGSAGTALGGTGGGLISIQATGTVTINGALSANGASGSVVTSWIGGAGAGGTIYISSNTFTGTTGTFAATGGSESTDVAYDGGGGGGGRVAIIYTTDSSSYLAGLTAVGVAAGGTAFVDATAGSTGTLYPPTGTIPTQPSITAPADAATGVSRNPTITASVYSGSGSHLSTDWQVATDSGFTSVVWSSITDTDDLESIVVNSTKGTFAGTLTGQTKLNPATYYIRTRYTNSTGNSTYSTTTSFTTTNTAPTVSSVTAAEKTNDTSVVDVSFVANDANADDQVMVKVELDIGAGYIDPTLSAVNADTTATYGDPTVDNAATYQIGTSAAWITTSSGANTINFDLAASNFTGANTTATVRLTPNDQGVDGTPVTQTFTIDDVNPTLPGSFANTAVTISSATFTWTASTETNFNHYEIWYGTNTTDVTNRSGTASEWDNDPNDAALATRTTATTTVTGLTTSTVYYTSICAVDNYGNTTCSPSPITFNTSGAPTAASVSCSERTDGSNNVVVSSIINDIDLDDTVRMKLEGSVDGGASWSVADPTISIGNADTTATYGDPGVDNSATYQVGTTGAYILTSSGANTVSTVWHAGTDVADTTNITNGRVRVTPYDGTNVGTPVSSADCVIDLVAPTLPGSFTTGSVTSGSALFTWTASTETNFNHYEIWYGTNTTDVTNRSGTASEWDNDPNDAALATRTTATTTITSLSSTATYYAKICAVDNYGHETCSPSNVTFTTGTPPTVSAVSASEKTDGSNVVDIQFTVADVDNNDQVMARIEVNTGSGWNNATLVTTNADTTAEWGDPKVNNAQTFNGTVYQVGTATGYILTSSGENRVQADLAASNFTGINSSTVQFRVTANDQGNNSTTVTSANFIIDTTSPTVPGSFAKSVGNGNNAPLSWTASTETNFDHYEIWYGLNQTHVQNRTGTATEFDNSPDDPNLALITTTTTTPTLLTAQLTYYALICAVDAYGHEGCSSPISFYTNTPPAVSAITLTSTNDGTGNMNVTFTIADSESDGNLNAVVEYNLQDGAGWKKATLTSATTHSAGSAPTINNALAYPISGIAGPSSGNNIGVTWDSLTDVGSATVDTVLIRVRTADSVDIATVQAGSSVIIDNVAPVGLGSFQASTYSSNTIKWLWSSVTETHFLKYEIWYGTNLNDVNNRTGTATRWDEGNASNLNTRTTTNTTLTGLSANTVYYAKLFAKDQYLNETTVTAISFKTNALAAVNSLTETHNRAGDGFISINLTVGDVDTSDVLKGSFQYNIGQGWYNGTIYLVSGSGVTLDNDATQQLGNISVTSGPKTIRTIWDSRADLPTTEVNTAQVRFVPYDQIESGAVTTLTNALVDNVAPNGLANFTKKSSSTSEIAVAWTPTITEPFFDHYEIWYGTDAASVTGRTGTATKWDTIKDAALAQVSTASTTITGLGTQTVAGQKIAATPDYYFKIFAVDQAGNEATSNTIEASPVAGDANGDGTNDSSPPDNTVAVPVFTGSLPNVSFIAGQTTATVFDLDDYFTQADGLPLTYSVAGQHYLTVNITDGAVQFTGAADFSGSESLTFYATDTNNQSASSNAVVVTVTAADTTDTGDTEQIDHVTGTNHGQGVIQVIGTSGTVLAQWTAFLKGGVVPRLATINGTQYVFAVKVRSGSTLYMFTTSGQLVVKQRISPQLHWRTLAAGDLDGNPASEEIVVATRRDSKYYLKLYQFRAGKTHLHIEKRFVFTGVKSNHYTVSIQNQLVLLKKPNNTVIQHWLPY